jgi:hypothetical protein
MPLHLLTPAQLASGGTKASRIPKPSGTSASTTAASPSNDSQRRAALEQSVLAWESQFRKTRGRPPTAQEYLSDPAIGTYHRLGFFGVFLSVCVCDVHTASTYREFTRLRSKANVAAFVASSIQKPAQPPATSPSAAAVPRLQRVVDPLFISLLCS